MKRYFILNIVKWVLLIKTYYFEDVFLVNLVNFYMLHNELKWIVSNKHL